MDDGCFRSVVCTVLLFASHSSVYWSISPRLGIIGASQSSRTLAGQQSESWLDLLDVHCWDGGSTSVSGWSQPSKEDGTREVTDEGRQTRNKNPRAAGSRYSPPIPQIFPPQSCGFSLQTPAAQAQSPPKRHGRRLLLRRPRPRPRRHLRHPVGGEVPTHPRRWRRRQLRCRRPPGGHCPRRQHAQPHPLRKRHFLEHLPRAARNGVVPLPFFLTSFRAGASGDRKDDEHSGAGARASGAQLPRGRAGAQCLRWQVSSTVTWFCISYPGPPWVEFGLDAWWSIRAFAGVWMWCGTRSRCLPRRRSPCSQGGTKSWSWMRLTGEPICRAFPLSVCYKCNAVFTETSFLHVFFLFHRLLLFGLEPRAQRLVLRN